MANNPPGAPEDWTWFEAVALFQTVRDGQHELAARLLRSSTDTERVTLNLLRMLGVYLRGEEPEKLDRFIEVSNRIGPPPQARPEL